MQSIVNRLTLAELTSGSGVMHAFGSAARRESSQWARICSQRRRTLWRFARPAVRNITCTTRDRGTYLDAVRSPGESTPAARPDLREADAI
jgi:hypothetical protein